MDVTASECTQSIIRVCSEFPRFKNPLLRQAYQQIYIFVFGRGVQRLLLRVCILACYILCDGRRVC
jgi:hypothetical protein